jgi:hypothetical protein
MGSIREGRGYSVIIEIGLWSRRGDIPQCLTDPQRLTSSHCSAPKNTRNGEKDLDIIPPFLKGYGKMCALWRRIRGWQKQHQSRNSPENKLHDRWISFLIPSSASMLHSPRQSLWHSDKQEPRKPASRSRELREILSVVTQIPASVRRASREQSGIRELMLCVGSLYPSEQPSLPPSPNSKKYKKTMRERNKKIRA